jgi:SAM-dependent methyltransferase
MDERVRQSLHDNRDLWDKRVRAHLDHGLYPSASVEAGTYALNAIEIAEIGDVTGRSLVHLQCNAGADTLGWARLGARVTGVDFSSVAIEEARRLADVTGVDASFVCADLFDLPRNLGRFDIAYSSMGVLWWLPDLTTWASVVASLLVDGGFFYLFEIHPIASCMRERDGWIALDWDYFGGSDTVVKFETSGTYYDAPDGFAAEPATEHGHIHGLGDVVNALVGAGLHIDFLHEHEVTSFRMIPSMVQRDDLTWVLPEGARRLPLTFSLRATRTSSVLA